MSPDELKARARRLAQEVMTQGDLAVVDELIAREHVHHVPGAPPVSGPRGVKEWVGRMRRAFPDIRAIVEDEIAEGDRVVQRVTVRGTHEGAFLGVLPTGLAVAFGAIEINRAGPDGRFVECWTVIDRLELLRQLEAATTPAPRPHPDGSTGATIAGHTEARARGGVDE